MAAVADASNRHSMGEQRLLDYILQFTVGIHHVKAKENRVADALSHVFILSADGSSVSMIEFNLLAEDQPRDEQLQLLRTVETGLQLRDGKILLCNAPADCPLEIFPQDLRRKVFQSLHSLSHLAIRSTQCLITQRFVWPSVNCDVRR